MPPPSPLPPPTQYLSHRSPRLNSSPSPWAGPWSCSCAQTETFLYNKYSQSTVTSPQQGTAGSSGKLWGAIISSQSGWGVDTVTLTLTQPYSHCIFIYIKGFIKSTKVWKLVQKGGEEADIPVVVRDVLCVVPAPSYQGDGRH